MSNKPYPICFSHIGMTVLNLEQLRIFIYK